MKQILLIILVFSLFSCTSIKEKTIQKKAVKQDTKKTITFSQEVKNLEFSALAEKKIQLTWDIPDKSNIEKVEISRSYLIGDKYEILDTLDSKYELYETTQDILAYAMYKVRLISKEQSKSRGTLIKVLPKTPNFRKFYFPNYENSEEEIFEVYEVIKENGIDYILIDDIFNIVRFFYGDIEYKKSNSLVELSNTNDLKISFNLKENKAFYRDKSGNSITAMLLELIEKDRAFRLKSGLSNKVDIATERYSDKLNSIFYLNLNEKDVDLDKYHLKFINKNNKNYFPLYLLTDLLFNNTISFIEIENGFAIYNYNCLNIYKKENLSSQLKEFTFLYFIELCKNNFTVSKDKNIDFDKIKSENYDKLMNTKSNEKFYSTFSDIIANFDDWHSGLSAYGKSPFDIKGTVLNKNLKEQYDAFNEFRKTIPEKTFDRFYTKDISDDIGYFYMLNYSDDAKSNIDRMIRKFKDKKTIIIDERSNPGGYISTLIYLAEYLADDYYTIHFLNDEELIHKRVKNSRDLRYKGNLILLTNRFSYSASTFFAAIAKENNIATIIGEKTNGGGSPTVPFTLPDNSTVHISSSTLLVDANGNSYDNGIEPDILVEENYTDGQDAVLEKAIEYANSL